MKKPHYVVIQAELPDEMSLAMNIYAKLGYEIYGPLSLGLGSKGTRYYCLMMKMEGEEDE